MPFANEHRARLRDPADFDPDSYRRTDGGRIFGRIKVPKTIAVIWAKLKGRAAPSDYPIVQALAFPVEHWTVEAAKSWLADHEVKYILFEPAPARQPAGGKEGEAAARRGEVSLAAGRRIVLATPHALAAGGLKVQREKRRIENVSILTRGPAIGHGFDVDDVMLSQVAGRIAAQTAGVKCRFTHSSDAVLLGPDPLTVMLGRVGSARVEGDRIRGDVQFGRYASRGPWGDLAAYLMDIAEDDPSIAGLSLVFETARFEERSDEHGRSLPPAGRVREVLAVDFVGDPGANPEGLR